MGQASKDSNRFKSINQPKVYVQLDELTEHIPMYEEMKHFPKNSRQHLAFVKYTNVVHQAVFTSLRQQYGYKIIFMRVAGQSIEKDAIDVTNLAIQQLESLTTAKAA